MKYRILAVIVMLFTIYFSNTPNLMVAHPNTWTNSTQYEDLELGAIVSSTTQFLEPWSETKDFNFILHKISHVTFYALMTFFLLLYSNKVRDVFWKLAFIFVFALSDEVHQYFVVGRSGRIIDTFLDFTSALVILLLLIISKKILLRQKKTRSLND